MRATDEDPMLRSTVIALAIGLSGPAAAQDLSTALEVWSFTEAGLGGNTGDDTALGIAIDSQGNYVVVGAQDGDPGHGLDAFVRKYDNQATLLWEVVDDRGPASATKTATDDAYWDVAVDSADQVLLTGEVSGDAATGWDSGYYLAKLTDYDGALTWSDTWQDGGASTNQGGRGVAIDPNQDVVVTGWSFRHPNQTGQWATHRYITTTGARDLGPLYYDLGTDPFAMDQALDVAVDSNGDIIVVGAVSSGSATGPDDTDRDWHVRKYAGIASGTGTTGVVAGALLWEHTWSGAAGLDDVATAVAVDNNDEIIVVGYTNTGTDNGANADYDWRIAKYDSTGAAGLGNPLFEITWSDPTSPGAKEMLFDVHMADNGMDFIVGGTWDDGGNAAWRVANRGFFDGAEQSAWAWPATGGDSVLQAIDVRDGRVVAAGSAFNGTDLDIQVILLDQDSDGDTVADSVDGCPLDATKVDPGVCGCGNPDVDTDGDSFLDCDDACPDLADKWTDEGICGCDEPDEDRDGDGTMDCVDNCPDDPNKTTLGVCGCNVPDDDSDGDGVLGCDDACSQTPPGTPVDENGCPAEVCDDGIDNNNDTRVDCDDDDCASDPACANAGGDGEGGGKGCGCDAAPGAPAGAVALALWALVVRRRR